jgi:hypothetical protein
MTQENEKGANELIGCLKLGLLAVVAGYVIRMWSLYVVVTNQNPIFWGSVAGIVLQMLGGLWLSLHLFRYAILHRDMQPNVRGAMLLCATLLVAVSFFATLVPLGPRI